jgi:hypothetical protein
MIHSKKLDGNVPVGICRYSDPFARSDSSIRDTILPYNPNTHKRNLSEKKRT